MDQSPLLLAVGFAVLAAYLALAGLAALALWRGAREADRRDAETAERDAAERRLAAAETAAEWRRIARRAED